MQALLGRLKVKDDRSCRSPVLPTRLSRPHQAETGGRNGAFRTLGQIGVAEYGQHDHGIGCRLRRRMCCHATTVVVRGPDGQSPDVALWTPAELGMAKGPSDGIRGVPGEAVSEFI